jgi:uncharacterized membrane protein
MAQNVLRFLLLLVLALLVGTMFGIWVGFNPMSLSASAYVEQQQNAIRSLNTLLPAMGAACIALAVALAVVARDNRRCRYLLLAAVVLLVFAAAVTRFGNQPINAVVIAWNAQSPPAEWVQLRNEWWQWHIARTLAAIGSLVLVIVASLSTPQRGQANSA